MKAVVTRKGVGPALIRGNGPRSPNGSGGTAPGRDAPRGGAAAGPWAKLILAMLGFAFALIVAHPILAQALSPAATAPLVQADAPMAG